MNKRFSYLATLFIGLAFVFGLIFGHLLGPRTDTRPAIAIEKIKAIAIEKLKVQITKVIARNAALTEEISSLKTQINENLRNKIQDLGRAKGEVEQLDKEQEKISATQVCGKPERSYNIPVSDQSKRLYSISQMKCTWTNLEIAGVEIKDETSTCFAEVHSEELRFNCFSLFTSGDGEKYSGRWVGSFDPNDEVEVVSTTLTILEGDSKLKGLSSKWTCKVKHSTDGTATSDCEGT